MFLLGAQEEGEEDVINYVQIIPLTGKPTKTSRRLTKILNHEMAKRKEELERDMANALVHAFCFGELGFNGRSEYVKAAKFIEKHATKRKSRRKK